MAIRSMSLIPRIRFWHVLAMLVAATAVLFVAVPRVEATVAAVGFTPSVETSTDEETAVSTVADDGATAEVTVAADTFEEGTTVTVAVVTNIEDVQQQAPPSTSSAVVLVLAFTLSATDAAGDTIVEDFATPVAISFTVPAASVPASGTDDLVVAFLGADGNWVYLTVQVVVNADGSVTLTGEVDHFTLFAVIQLTPTVFEVPPQGGLSIGVSGTNKVARLVAVQSGDIEAMFVLDVPTQTWFSFVIGGPAFANTLNDANLTPDSIVWIRFVAPK